MKGDGDIGQGEDKGSGKKIGDGGRREQRIPRRTGGRAVGFPRDRGGVSFLCRKGDFSCKTKIKGYTVLDILVWQIDHFKAAMDRGRPGMGDNGSKMALRAFDTLLKMEKEPEKYIQRMQSETGTDYPEKY